MKLTRIQLRQFRQFSQELQITDIAPGMNVFHGPNESGKSTVVQAIRAAFFERHNSGALSGLQPWGDSSAAPEVRLDFEFKQHVYTLHKRFMRQRRCDLTVDGRALDGDQAEQYLAELMGFSIPARGASRPDHWGVPGLLWIEQGAGQELGDSVAHAKQQLQGILHEAMGHVASSDGDRVLQVVEDKLSRLLTRATGVPTQEYKKALDRQQVLQSELQQMDSTIQDYQRQVDHLTELRHEQDQDTREQPWVILRQKEAEARRQLESVHTLQTEQQHEREALEACRKNLQLLAQQLQTFQQQKDRLQQREIAINTHGEQLRVLSDQSAGLQKDLDDARHEHQQAREQLTAYRQAWQHHHVFNRYADVRADLQRLEQQYEQALHAQEARSQLQVQAGKVRLKDEELQDLRELHDRLQAVRIRQQGVATRLKFDLEAGQSIQLGEDVVTGQAERLLLEDATLFIPGIGRICVTPGGADVPRLMREGQRLQDEWQASLQALGVASLEQAQSRHADYREVMARLDQCRMALDLHAPEGVAALRAQLDELRQQVAGLEQQYDDLSSDMLNTVPDLNVDDLNRVQHREQEAEARLKSCESLQHKHQVALATAQLALTSAQQEYQQAHALMLTMQNQDSESLALQQLSEERAREQSLQARIADYQVRIDAVRPDVLEQDIMRFGQSAAQLYEASLERERSIRELTGQLQALGAQGLEERRDALKGELTLVRRRVSEFARNAAALVLLQGLLSEQRQVLTRRLHAPLRERLMHYLGVLFGGAAVTTDIIVGEDLAPARLVRDHDYADFQELSFGAREQLGLISRLAYADLLQAAGRPALIILDDALVHSDAGRLARMKQVLFDAAQRHQTLLFTCQPDKWQDVGVMPRAMNTLAGTATGQGSDRAFDL